MEFKWEFYLYQNKILETFEKEILRWDDKIHIIAPPWSWKTIVWLEMVKRLLEKKQWVILILVPNITLQYQWKDKLEKFFLDKDENIEDLVSFELEKIKKINILTYQSITQTKRWKKDIDEMIFSLWERKLSKDEIFSLKENEPEVYQKEYLKYKDKLKSEINENEILSEKVLNYIKELKKYWLAWIVLDEAHHLKSWWSKVVYYIYTQIKTYIVGLTATAPFDDVDFFILDENYQKLLWEIDFYLPTPAIVKSWKLAPYTDLSYFVEPNDKIKQILQEKKEKLNKKLDIIRKDLKCFFDSFKFDFNDKNTSKLLNFIDYLQGNTENYKLDDLVYSLSWYFRKNTRKLEDFKSIFYELWYVWKNNRFTKFYTFEDKYFVYNPDKIIWVKKILDKEIENLGNNLQTVIITDFLEDVDGFLDCKYILRNLKDYKKYNPVLVSGQWIWKLWKNDELELVEDENILSITEKFDKWEIKILIWTRWILWEWWDSVKVNTLIDLTWTKSFMTTNQVRWRAIRKDPDNPNKVANIYDIVTIDKNNLIVKDIERLKTKHMQVYGIDDAWIIIKWVNHIYPNLLEHISDYKKINENMLFRSEKRKYFYDLWWIWKDFQNKETFALTLETIPINKYYIFDNKNDYLENVFKFIDFDENNKWNKLEIWNIWDITDYDIMLKSFLEKIIKNYGNILKEQFYEEIDISVIAIGWWIFKILVNMKDDLKIKKVIEILSKVFTKITVDVKYLHKISFFELENWRLVKKDIFFPLPKELSSNNMKRSKLIYSSKKDFDYYVNMLWMDVKTFLDLDFKNKLSAKKYYWYSKIDENDEFLQKKLKNTKIYKREIKKVWLYILLVVPWNLWWFYLFYHMLDYYLFVNYLFGFLDGLLLIKYSFLYKKVYKFYKEKYGILDEYNIKFDVVKLKEKYINKTPFIRWNLEKIWL